MLRVTRNQLVLQVPKCFRKSKYEFDTTRFSQETFFIGCSRILSQVELCGFEWQHVYMPNWIKLKHASTYIFVVVTIRVFLYCLNKPYPK
jgi:hypothetical protein